MRRLRVLLVVLAGLAAVPAAAQTVRVKSGEHEDFSRLVFYFPERPDYELVETDGGYELRAGADYAYDTSDVFRLIPRDRVAGLGMVDGALRIELACNCPAEVVDYAPRILVLDVRDPQRTDPEAAAPAGRPGPWRNAERLRPATAAPRSSVAIARFDGLAMPRPTPLLPGALAESAGAGTTATAAAAPEVAVSNPPADAIVGDLLAQIGRAASQGLLEADLSATKRLVEKATPKPVDAPEPEAPKTPVPAPSATGSHVAIRTSIDRDLGERFGRLVRDATDAACLPNSAFDVLEWKRTGFDGADLAAYRAKLIGEFDAADPAAVRDLARHLIALTFGAEAAAVLRVFPDGVKDRDLLLTLAEIVDHGHAAGPTQLDGQFGCPTAAALWSALAQEEIPPGAEIDTGAIVSTFSALPLHLRRHLGPDLAERFIRAGMTPVALSLRNAIARAPGAHGERFELLEVELETDPDAADERLQALAETGRSAEALALSIERQSSAGRTVASDTLENAAAMAYELKGTDLAARLKRAEIEALIVNGTYDRALDELRRAVKSGMAEAELERELTADTYLAAARSGPDADFLRLAFRADKVLGVDEAGLEARRALAERLLKHRLGGQARALVSQEQILPTVRDRLILSEAALYDGRADVALGYVMGLHDPRAEALRGRIAVAERRAGLAAAAEAPANAPAAEAAPPTARGVTLQNTRTLLQSSTAARARLKALLSGNAVSGAEG